MKVVKWLAIIVIAFVALFVVIGLLLPSRFNVQRSVVIDAEPAKIHALVGDLARWPEWEPWTETDPTMKVTIEGASTGTGAKQTWTADRGNGGLTITRWDVNTGVAYAMQINDGEMTSIGTIKYAPAEGGTMVTWNWSGDLGMNPFMRWFGSMFDQKVGPIFQSGLDTLKEKVESMPDPMPEPEEGVAQDETTAS